MHDSRQPAEEETSLDELLLVERVRVLLASRRVSWFHPSVLNAQTPSSTACKKLCDPCNHAIQPDIVIVDRLVVQIDDRIIQHPYTPSKDQHLLCHQTNIKDGSRMIEIFLNYLDTKLCFH